MSDEKLKQITWIGSSREDLKTFPKVVQKEIGFTLHRIQEGKKPLNIKPLKGLASGTMEIVSSHNKCTYRAIYILKLGDDIYVLHAFQKKSKMGIKTPKQEIDLIKKRLKIAQEDAKYRTNG